MEHVLEEYYIEPDLIKKPEVEKDDELSGDWISDEFVSVEDGEETTVVGERDNGNEKEREQSDNNVIIIAD